MSKSLEQLNREFIDELASEEPKALLGKSDQYEQWFSEMLEEMERAKSPEPPKQRAPLHTKAPPHSRSQEPFRPLAAQQQQTQVQVQTQEPTPGQAASAARFDTIRIDREAVLAEAKAHQEVNAPPPHAPPPQKQKKRAGKLVSDIVFYSMVAFILVTMLFYSGRDNNGFHMFGYSGFVVLGGSMEREIPQGSLVITRKVDPEDIKLGDDITFIRRDNATVTHRVVDIIDNYENSGVRVFKTKGLENPEPDPDPVFEGNVIGVVKHAVPELGFFLNYISNNIVFIFIILGGILIAAVATKRVFLAREDKKAREVAAA